MSGSSFTPGQHQVIRAAIGQGQFSDYDSVMTVTNWTSLDDVFVQQTPVLKPGYGFNAHSTTVQLSMVVLLLYSLIAAFYLCLTCMSGQTSSGWDSTGELLMLGFKSKWPAFLGRTSAGLMLPKTYQEQVSLMVNEDDGLELVFDKDPDNDERLYKGGVKANTAY